MARYAQCPNCGNKEGWFTDRTQDAVDVLQRSISLNPESEIAIQAGKELARLGRL
jgi:hypothetical protein